MKYILLFWAAWLFVGHAEAQKKSMELNTIITDQRHLLTFIAEDFQEVQPDRGKLMMQNHSLSFEAFNRQLRDTAKAYSLLGAPINNLYAYVTDTGFALYVLMEFDQQQADSFMAAWGVPENVESKEEVVSGGFTFLHWGFKPLDIFVMKDRFAGGSKTIVAVTNMKLADLLSNDYP